MSFINRIKFFLTNLRRLGVDNIAYNRINNWGDYKAYIPYTQFALSPVTILHILNEIVINKRKVIIEFGCGVSTIYISRLINTMNLNIKFFSIDNDLDWINTIKEQLKLDNVLHHTKFIHAPLDQDSSWFSKEVLDKELDAIKDFDLIIVDGPFGALKDKARHPAIPYLKDRLNSTYAIFLDDTHRKKEREIIGLWRNILPESKIEHFRKYSTITRNAQFESIPAL